MYFRHTENCSEFKEEAVRPITLAHTVRPQIGLSQVPTVDRVNEYLTGGRKVGGIGSLRRK